MEQTTDLPARIDGGTSVGIQSEILIDPVSGARKPVTAGQRWLCVIQQNHSMPMYVTAWHTEYEAQAHMAAEVRCMDNGRSNVLHVIEGRLQMATTVTRTLSAGSIIESELQS